MAEIYGLMAEFEHSEEIVEATRRAYAEGYRNMDAYTPFPMHEVFHELHDHRTWVPPITLVGGVVGLVGGFMLQTWTTAIDYPLNIGGRPLFSWPAFIPITFECMVLLAAFSAVIGMLALNGLPQPYHPVFNTPGFERCGVDRFFLCIESSDPRFDRAETARFLNSLGAQRVSEVEP